ncbi:hypothetical protein JG687_00018044 [Phytophthora cactorum]|uniref:Uncharacterized protein n=1 Tax=Phytophthora cactorum TaxID=29920 RepID=A0A8T1TNI6_9STRA|nr:hypothetical protein GQ600_5321 [Phytophthora cactorum]KAG6944109.1 hypothetical protein JG687_00018044 [Phytophthora cactorum]
MGTMQHGVIVDGAIVDPFMFCLGGFNNTNAAKMLISVLYAQRKAEDRSVVCSSLSLGKEKEETDRRAKIDFFVMYSWTQDEYIHSCQYPSEVL